MKDAVGRLRVKIDELFFVGENGNHVIPGPFRILICVILCLTTAALIECVAFQFPAVWFDSETETFFGSDEEKLNYHCEESLAELSAEEINSIIVERNNAKLMAEYLGKPYEEEKDDTLVETEDGKFYRKVQLIIMDVRLSEKKYIGQFDLRIAETAGAQSGYSLFLYEDGEQNGDTLFCSIDSRIRAGVTRVGKSADRVRIELMTTEDLSPENIQFTLSNDFSPNLIRILWITVLLVMGMMLIECRNVLSERPQWGFAYVCFTVGCLLILGIGTNQVSYDEHVHAKAAYKLSFGSQIETTETAMQMGGNLLPVFHNRQERELVEAYEQLNHDYSWADIGFQSRWVRSENRVYYPIAAGFFVGRVLGLSFADTVALAKLGNLLVYVLVCFFAISFAKAYRELVMMIALLPNHVFLASAISYDMVVNAFLLLGVVLLYHELLEPDGPLEWKNLLIMLLSFAFGCQSKPIYILMACMVIFYGSRKFDCRWKEVVCKLSVLIVAGLMLYNIFRPTPVAGSDYHLVSNITYAGDKRNVGSSVLGQIQWIFSNPLSYTILLLSQMRDMLFSYLFGGKGFFQYGYTGEAPMPVTWGVLGLAIFLAWFQPAETPVRGVAKPPRKGLSKWNIFFTVLMCFGMSAVIWTSMYVSYTSVGADEIRGVQGRYFTPLFLPLLLCLVSEEHPQKLTRLARNRIVLAVMGLLNLLMVAVLVISAYDL